MINARFFEFFWVTFIGLIGMLGLALALVAGTTLAMREISVAITAVALSAGCGALCVMAEEARYAASTLRR